MNVEDNSPASCPSVASSISTPNPTLGPARIHAQQHLVQSWASVPPAPASIDDGVIGVVRSSEETLGLERGDLGFE